MRVGLVLGGGGVMGGAWMTGGLHALATETGWDPASADYIVGTSAGSMVGALIACGVPPWFMVAHSSGEVFRGLVDGRGEPVEKADRAAGAVFRLERRLPRLLPGSPHLIMSTLRHPGAHPPAALLAGWAPWGLVSTEPLKDLVRRALPSGWPPHENLWICACNYRTAELTVFGRKGSPQADLADAVAASCAIPGFYRPVRIGRDVYVDGGMHSASNADLLAGEDVDLIICLNPSTPVDAPRRWPHQKVAAAVRSMIASTLHREIEELRSRGKKVILVQPTAADVETMGINWMNRRRRNAVIEKAVETVSAQLREPQIAALLSTLPPGEAHKIGRPSGPPSTWPPMSIGAGMRRTRATRGAA